ncbi:tetratricopeptide repeat protein [Devosia sp.]|uniref:tetratricopeptide repeat protein n=1 Tax=Devosia sp. TaxID=1871048 RepID=UPI0035B15D7D
MPRLLLLPPTEFGPVIDPRDCELSRSLIADVTLSLCRSRLYDVVAPFTAQQLRDSAVAEQAIPFDYVVRISLVGRDAPLPFSLLRIDIGDARTGESLHQGEMELRTGNMIGLHQGLSSVVVDRICGRIAREELLRYRRTGAASAYVHYLLAMRRGDRTDLPSLQLAQKSLARSIQLAPDFVPALSELARTKTLEWLERGSADRALLKEATHLAERGHRYDPLDSSSLREIGHAALYQHDLASALAHFDAALELAPNHADLLVDQADVLTHMSRHVEAETLITRALALNPLAPDDYYWIGGAVSFFRERYQEAIDRLTAMRSPGLALRLLAASAAMNGDADDARRYRDLALKRDPSFTVSKWTSLYPEPNQSDTAHYLRALRMAGFS